MIKTTKLMLSKMRVLGVMVLRGCIGEDKKRLVTLVMIA